MSDPMSTGASGTEHRKDRSRDFRLVAMGVAAVLLVWFALANLQDVEIHFWVYSARASLIVVILISGLLGAGVTLLAIRSRRRSGSGSGPN
jgi:uncharacterized integral membrane protein